MKSTLCVLGAGGSVLNSNAPPIRPMHILRAVSAFATRELLARNTDLLRLSYARALALYIQRLLVASVPATDFVVDLRLHVVEAYGWAFGAICAVSAFLPGVIALAVAGDERFESWQ